MKRTLKTLVPLLVVFTVLLSGHFINAAWTAPSGSPSAANNAPVPINASSVNQLKSGDITALNLKAGSQMWSPEYCDENGQNCADSSSTGGGISLEEAACYGMGSADYSSVGYLPQVCEWSANTACGRVPNCNREAHQVYVGHTCMFSCQYGTTPQPTVGAWSVGAWSGCSQSCGGGTQTRSVTCNFDSCTGAQPATSQGCNTQACVSYNWQLGAATQSQNTYQRRRGGEFLYCRDIVSTRNYQCVASTGQVVADSLCAGSKPPAQATVTFSECNPEGGEAR